MAESQFMIFCSISDLKGVDLFRLDEGAKEDEAMVLIDMKGREVAKAKDGKYIELRVRMIVTF